MSRHSNQMLEALIIFGGPVLIMAVLARVLPQNIIAGGILVLGVIMLYLIIALFLIVVGAAVVHYKENKNAIDDG